MPQRVLVTDLKNLIYIELLWRGGRAAAIDAHHLTTSARVRLLVERLVPHQPQDMAKRGDTDSRRQHIAINRTALRRRRGSSRSGRRVINPAATRRVRFTKMQGGGQRHHRCWMGTTPGLLGP